LLGGGLSDPDGERGAVEKPALAAAVGTSCDDRKLIYSLIWARQSQALGLR
jgi:hypothetical protein